MACFEQSATSGVDRLSATRSVSSERILATLKSYYEGISNRMMSELTTISDQMDHMGERGRNNELIIAEFLKKHLPHRYTVTTGKVSAAG